MRGKLRAYARDHEVPFPETRGQLVRLILESLAESYRRVLADLDTLTGQAAETLVRRRWRGLQRPAQPAYRRRLRDSCRRRPGRGDGPWQSARSGSRPGRPARRDVTIRDAVRSHSTLRTYTPAPAPRHLDMTTDTDTRLDAAAALDSGDDYLRNRWDDAKADGMDAVDRLVYRSNLLGEDARITNTGGGNTSSKVVMPDPISGQDTEVLFVKGVGRRSADRKTGKLRVALSRRADATAGRLRRQGRARPQDAGRGRDGGDLPPHHVQPQPPRAVHRHAAPRLHPPKARRSHAPRRGDRHRDRRRRPGADARDLRRRGDLDRLAAPRLRAGPGAPADLPGAPRRQGAS